MSELHLIVIWNRAICKERELLDEIASRVKVLAACDAEWPVDAELGFRTFYGTKLKAAVAKVRECGAGPFRVIIVRDEHPRYEERNTSRGVEVVNATMFDLKTRCREIVGGNRIHATISPDETRRDILILTGVKADEWLAGRRPEGPLRTFPGVMGWPSLKAMFEFLNETTRYVVIRNAEMLPDAFDPTLHGDIDFLVEDTGSVARLLGARKVHGEPWRVHYEVMVGGVPLRLDLRHVGDDYYCEEWERDMLSRRAKSPSGVYVLPAEDGFFALVYHAMYQKPFVAADYPGKAAALARAAGIAGASFDEWLPLLEGFLHRNGYGVPVPKDKSVRYNRHVVRIGLSMLRIREMCGVERLRPSHMGLARGNKSLPTLLFEGEYRGVPCYVKYALAGEATVRREWKLLEKVRALIPDNCVKPMFWHADGSGGAIIVTERIDGESLSSLLSSGRCIAEPKQEAMCRDMLRIADALDASGVVHRDIRPGNMIVGDDGRVSLIDFQMAADRNSPVECSYVATRHYELLRHLGGKSNHPDGVWNDRRSMLACVRLLPASKARAEAESVLEAGVGEKDFTACLPRRMRRAVVARLWTLRIKRLACAIVGRRFRGESLLWHYSAVVSTWRFA